MPSRLRVPRVAHVVLVLLAASVLPAPRAWARGPAVAHAVPAAGIRADPARPQDVDAVVQEPAEAAGSVLARWTTFVAIAGLLGVVAFGRVVPPALERAGGGATATALRRALRPAGVVAGTLVCAAALSRLAAQHTALASALGGDAPPTLRDVVSGPWGAGFVLQLAAGAAGVLAFALPPARGRTATLALASASVAAAPALGGHAAGEGLRSAAMVADVAHVLAAGTWVGMLLCLVAVAIPLVVRRLPDELPIALPAMLRAFSPVALGSAAVLAVTGTYASVVHVGSFAALGETPYGHALLLKLGLVFLMLLLGAVNWRRRGPAAGTAAGAVQLARSAWGEFLVALAILLVTAVLVARPSPTDLGM